MLFRSEVLGYKSESEVERIHSEWPLTMGSEWRIADWNRGDAAGVARIALTMLAPALCPAIVIFEAEPPKLGTTACRNASAFMTSLTARLWLPSGARNPSCWMTQLRSQDLAGEY